MLEPSQHRARPRAIRSLGDDAWIVECHDADDARAAYAHLRHLHGTVFRDLVPAAATLMASANAGERHTAFGNLCDVARQPRGSCPATSESPLEIPTRYCGEDLESVAELLGMTTDVLIQVHSETIWTVSFIGFAPGFAYLTSSAWNLQIPRLAHPRSEVPRRSVAVADRYSAIYPRSTPGGWRLLGQTDFEPWNIDVSPPTQLLPGARVRFVARQ